MKPFLSKSIVWLVLMGFLFQPLSALALADPFTVPVADSALGQGGIPADIANKAAEIAYEAADKINIGCEKAEETNSIAEHGTEWALGGLSLIGGSAVEMGHLEAKIKLLEGFIICRERAMDATKAIVSINTYTANKKQLLENKINVAIQTHRKKKTDLMAEARIAKKGFWKSLIVSSLLKTTKVLAKKMANTLTSTYKISDFQRYADVVGSQVYTTQLIQNNGKDKSEQLMLRSLINNPLAQNQISPSVVSRADTSLGLDLDNYDVSNADFFLDMARVGAGPNNAYTLNIGEIDKAYSLASKGKADAEKEIQQSNGLKSPRTCKGSMSDQKNIDQQFKSAEKEYQDRLKLYNDLKQGWIAKGLTSEEIKQLGIDYKKAEADMLAAKAKLDALPQKFDSPVLTICEDIVSPATTVDKGIDKGFGFFEKNMSDYNNEHLPFFVNFVSGLVSDISSDLIFGGNPQRALLHESGNINKAIGTAIAAGTQGSGTNLESGVVFETEKSSNAADAYIINWDVQGVKDASYVTISGTGISGANRLPVSGSTEIHTSSSGSYMLKVFDKSGKQLTLSSLELQVQAPSGVSDGMRGPTVFGASIQSQPVYIRGK